jgi:mRNA-degrading endonuclease toxin of MazEF toxin-antitoxin module
MLCPYCGEAFDEEYYYQRHVPCPHEAGDRKHDPVVQARNEAIITYGGEVKLVVRTSDRKKTPTKVAVRPMTEAEVRALKQYDRVAFLSQRDGRLAELRITSVKTWKTRPDVHFGVARGLKDRAKLDLQEALAMMVVIVDEHPEIPTTAAGKP